MVFGIALGVKHNAWLMPIFLVGHYLWMRRHDLIGGRGRRRIPPVPLVFLAMAVLGPLVFLLHWPWLWVYPIGHTRWYVQRHMQHEHYNFEYLGRNWNNPPKEWDRKLLRMTFPFVSTGAHRPGHHAGAGRGRAACSCPPRLAPAASTDDDTLACPIALPAGLGAAAARPGCARRPTSTGRRALSCSCRSWGRWRCWPCRARPSSAASSTSCPPCRTWPSWRRSGLRWLARVVTGRARRR